MAVKIRLARHGAKKRPFYRIVVADERMPRDGRFIEQVGIYNPVSQPHMIQVDLDKVDEWIGKGAQMSDSVSHLVDIARNGYEPAAPKRAKKSKKQLHKDREAAELAAAQAAESAE